jgi:hypothetical protein
MNVFGKWAPLVQALGLLVGVAFFAQRARRLWQERKRRRLLSKRPRRTD